MKSTPSLLDDTTIFTYGFELEGVFSQDLNIEGHLGYDGSVHIGDGEFDFVEYDGREYRSDVFHSLGGMLEQLRIFTSSVYASNDTCGLHIHIKPKNEAGKKLCNAIASREGLNLVAETHIKISKMDRWQNRRRCSEGCKKYARPYDISDPSLGLEWKARAKYREVRNHPQGTYEFRLFSPQGSVEEREKRIISFFTELFEAVEKLKLKSQIKVQKELPRKPKVWHLEAHTERFVDDISDNLRTSPALCVLSL